MSEKDEPREPRWAENETDFLRENYTQLPIAAIAAQLGRSYEAVRRKAAKVGVRKREWHGEFTPEEDGIILEKYAASPMSEMTALLGRHHNSIRQRARTLGLVNPEQVKRAYIAAGVRHDYFSRPDSPIKAYLLGLMATDGSVSSKENRISFKIGIKDIELAELMRDEISPNSVIGVYTYPPLPGYAKERKVACFAVSSAQMRADLAGLGIVPRKTFIIERPILEPRLSAPFILGCFDGDGCLQWRGRPWQWTWTLYSASERFIVSARESIQQQTGFVLKVATSKRGLHEVKLTGGRRIEVLDAWLHADVRGLSRKTLPPDAYARAQQEILTALGQTHVRRDRAGRYSSQAAQAR